MTIAPQDILKMQLMTPLIKLIAEHCICDHMSWASADDVMD